MGICGEGKENEIDKTGGMGTEGLGNCEKGEPEMQLVPQQREDT